MLGLVRFCWFILVENIYMKICDTKNVLGTLCLLWKLTCPTNSCAVGWHFPIFIGLQSPILIWRVFRSYLRFGYSFRKISIFRDSASPKKKTRKSPKLHFLSRRPVVIRLNSAKLADLCAICVKQLHYF